MSICTEHFEVNAQSISFHAYDLGRKWFRLVDRSKYVSIFSLSNSSFLTFPLRTDLCELQAGRIEVASTVGEGSIFRCFITARSVDRGLKQDDSRAIPVIEGITAPNASRGEVPRVFLSQPEEGSAPLSGLKVLCCECVLSRLSRSFLDFLHFSLPLLTLMGFTGTI